VFVGLEPIWQHVGGFCNISDSNWISISNPQLLSHMHFVSYMISAMAILKLFR
jgi:hypothetical protein